MRAWVRNYVHRDPMANVGARVLLVVHVFDDDSFRFVVDEGATARFTCHQFALFISLRVDAQLIMLGADRLVATFFILVRDPGYVIVANWRDCTCYLRNLELR